MLKNGLEMLAVVANGNFALLKMWFEPVNTYTTTYTNIFKSQFNLLEGFCNVFINFKTIFNAIMLFSNTVFSVIKLRFVQYVYI